MAVAPDGRYIYAGTAAQGLFASQDGGQTWIQTYPGQYAPNLAFNPNDPTQAVASLRDRLVRSGDGGRSWHTLPIPWASDEIASLLWLVDGTLGAGTGQGRLYRSLDGGETWLEGGTGLSSSGSVLTLAVVGRQAAASPPKFLAGTWTGLYANDDGGQTKLAPSPGGPKARALLATKNGLLLGTESGLFRWQPDSAHWTPTADEFLPRGVTSLAVAPADKQILYAGTGGDGVYRSDDCGRNWQAVPSPDVGVPALAVDPDNPDHVYMLAIWERVYESQNGGQNWQARWDGLGVTVEAASLAVNPLAPTVYVGAGTGLYRSRSGQDW